VGTFSTGTMGTFQPELTGARSEAASGGKGGNATWHKVLTAVEQILTGAIVSACVISINETEPLNPFAIRHEPSNVQCRESHCLILARQLIAVCEAGVVLRSGLILVRNATNNVGNKNWIISALWISNFFLVTHPRVPFSCDGCSWEQSSSIAWATAATGMNSIDHALVHRVVNHQEPCECYNIPSRI